MNIGSLWAEIGLDNAQLKVAAAESSSVLANLSTRVDNTSALTNVLSSSFVQLTASFTAANLASAAISQSIHAITVSVQYGIEAVDAFALSVAKTASMLTSFKVHGDVAANYRQARDYAKGLQDVLMGIDANTTLNLRNLQDMNEELIKQGVQFKYNSAAQVEGYTRIANAVAMYSRNGADERQLRQETRSLIMGEVNMMSQLAMMVQRLVKGPLREQVQQWKDQGVLIERIGGLLKGFGEGAKDLNVTWSAAKSSMETSLSLLSRAVFAQPYKDLVDATQKANTYIRENTAQITSITIPAYNAFKAVISSVALVVNGLASNSGALITAGGFAASMLLLASAGPAIGATAMALASAAAAWGSLQGGLNGTLAPSVSGILMLTSAMMGLSAAVIATSAGVGILTTAWASFMAAIDVSLASNPAGWIIALAAAAVYAGYKIAETLDKFNKAKVDMNKPMTMIASHEAFQIDQQKTMEQWEREKKQYEAQLGAQKAYNNAALALLRAQNESRKMIISSEYIQEGSLAKEHFDKLYQLDASVIQRQVEDAKESMVILAKVMKTIEATKGTGSPEYIKMQGDMRAQTIALQTLEQERYNSRLKHEKEFYDYVDKRALEQKTALNALHEEQTAFYVDRVKQENDIMLKRLSLEAELMRYAGNAAGADTLTIALKYQSQRQEAEDALSVAMALHDEFAVSAIKEYMHLLDLVIGKENDLAALTRVTDQANISIAKYENQLILIDQAEKMFATDAITAANQRIPLLQQEVIEQQKIYDAITGNEPTAQTLRQQVLDKITAINGKIIEQQVLLRDRTAVGGAIVALHEYADATLNAGEQTKTAVSSMLKGMEDALVTFVRHGKLSFTSLVNSILDDLARITVQRSITGPLAASLQGLLSSGSSPGVAGLGTVANGIPSVLMAPAPTLGPTIQAATAQGAQAGVAAGISSILPIIGVAVAGGMMINQMFQSGGLWNQSTNVQRGLRAATAASIVGLPVAMLDLFTGGGVFGTSWRNTGGGVDVGVQGGAVAAQQFVEITRKKALFGGSETQHLTAELNVQWSEFVHRNYDSIIAAIHTQSASIGMTITDEMLKSVDVAKISVNLAGKTAEEQQKAVNDAFRAINNDLIEKSNPLIKSLERLGEDATAAMERMTALKLTNNALLMQELELKGLKGTADYMALVNVQRENELLKMDTSTQVIQRRVWALQDEQDAMTRATEAAQKAAQVSKDLADSQARLQDAMLEAQKTQLSQSQQAVDDLTSSVEELRKQIEMGINSQLSILQAVQQMAGDSNLSVLSPETRYKQLQQQFNDQAARAQGGDEQAKAAVAQTYQQYIAASRQYNASGAAYQSDYSSARTIMLALANLPSTATMTDVAKQTEILNAIHDALGSTGDLAKLLNIGSPLVAALGTSSPLLQSLGPGGSISTGLGALATATMALSQAQNAALVQSKQVAYQSAVNAQSSREADVKTMQDALTTAQATYSAAISPTFNQAYRDLVNYGASSTQYATSNAAFQAAIAANRPALTTAENNLKAAQTALSTAMSVTQSAYDAWQKALAGQNSYDTGTAYVGYDQNAQIHKGEKVIDSQSSAILSRYGIKVQASGYADNRAVVDALDRMEKRLERLEELNSNGNGIATEVGKQIIAAGLRQADELTEIRKKAAIS